MNNQNPLQEWAMRMIVFALGCGLAIGVGIGLSIPMFVDITQRYV